MPNEKITAVEILHKDRVPNNSVDPSNCKSLSVALNEKQSSQVSVLSEALAISDAMEPNSNKGTKMRKEDFLHLNSFAVIKLFGI